MINYGQSQYWDQRYSEQQGITFDWLQTWQNLRSIIQPLISKQAKVLILGCGNAKFSQEMYTAGFQNLHNIDISQVVIHQMAQRNSDKPKMTWQVMDVRNLEFQAQSFDLAIDKSTIDTLLCGQWSYLDVALMTREVQRVIKTGAYYLTISYGAPYKRREHFVERHLYCDLRQQVVSQGTAKPHYVYLCQKKEGAEKVSQDNWGEVEARLREEALRSQSNVKVAFIKKE